MFNSDRKDLIVEERLVSDDRSLEIAVVNGEAHRFEGWECEIKGVLCWFKKMSVVWEAREKGRRDVDVLKGLKKVGNCHCGVETVCTRDTLQDGGVCTGPLEFGES